MSELRIVIDTSIAVSAVLLPRSIPRRAFDAAADLGKLLFSDTTLAELDEVSRRPKFDKYLSGDSGLEFLAELTRVAERVEVTATVVDCRDPKDYKFPELAVDGRASHILTGDGDLLALHPFRGVAIVTPQVFLARSPGDGSILGEGRS